MADEKKHDDRFSHLDEEGRARMVDVSGKPETDRVARASARISMSPETLRLLGEKAIPKGDVLAVARVAGIMAAKETPGLIPLCHPLELGRVDVDFKLDEARPAIVIETEAGLRGKTGAEMEALTAAAVAALTIYDMCKAVDKGMVIDDIRVLEKRGGRSG